MADHSHREREQRGGRVFFSREAVSGIPWMVLGKLLLFFVYFGVIVLTVNILGKEKFGVYSLMVNISSSLMVFCGLGLGSAITRYVPELSIHRNRRGLIYLLWKSALLQALAVCGAAALLFLFAAPLQRLFNAGHIEHFRFYLMLACVLVAFMLLKEFVATVFTAMFRMRAVTMLSIFQGLAWLALLSVWLVPSPEVATVFYVQMLSLGLVYTVGVTLLVRHVRELPWRTLPYGIGRQRALRFSGTAMASAVLRTITFKYSEIFFLAAVGGTTLAGVYDLGYSLPFTAITFIPLALLSLFTAAFAEAYVKDPDCLGHLISSYYKMLIMVSLPISVLGAFFAPATYRIIYRGAMDEAGQLASVFCIVLTFPLISIPLSMALKAKEKAHGMLPMLLLQIAVNLLLDWLLIVHLGWGAWGGVAAVAGTFFITIAPRLLVVRRIIGGVHFPVGFFLRILSTLVFEAVLFFMAVRQTRALERLGGEWLSLGLLFAVAASYLLLFLLMTRHFRLVRQSDIADFRALGIPRLNRLLDWVFGV